MPFVGGDTTVLDTIFRPYRSGEAERSDRSAGDRARHRTKVRAAIKENIGDIIAEESIIGQERGRVVRVPLRGIKEYRFVYGDNDSGASSGDGNTEEGQVVGKTKNIKGKKGPGRGEDAGDEAGEDYYDTDVSLDELLAIMFEDLCLPAMEEKPLRVVESERTSKRKGYRDVGIRARLDRKRTVKAKLRRELATVRSARFDEDEVPEDDRIDVGDDVPEDDRIDAEDEVPMPGAPEKVHFPFHQDDLTYRHMMTEMRPQSNAVVVAMMDTSGSMDAAKKYLARSFFFLLYNFVRTKYDNVEVVFIAHTTEAKEVTEDEFFHKGESGGTMISSAYIKALEVIGTRYHPDLWNIYAFHCSDGDNFSSDNPTALAAARELCAVSNLFGYGEIRPGSAYSSYETTMHKVVQKIEAPNFVTVTIRRKEDVWPAFRNLLIHDVGSAKAAAGDGPGTGR